MTQTKDLHYFEHNLLPRMFYEQGEQLIEKIKAQKAEFILSALKAANNSGGSFKCPYSADDFEFTKITFFNCDCTMIMLQLPERDEVTSCRSIYMAWNSDWTSQFYYTVEKNIESKYYFCGWTADHAHIIFAPKVPEKQLFETRELITLFSELDEYKDSTKFINT